MPFDIDIDEAASAVAERLKPFAKDESDEALREFASTAIALDLEFMITSGATLGEPYDEDAAFTNLKAGLAKKKHRLAKLAEDFSEVWEEYLSEAGFIEWD